MYCIDPKLGTIHNHYKESSGELKWNKRTRAIWAKICEV